MALYNERGNIRVTVDDTSMPFGIYAADGSLRVTVVDGTTFTGLYDSDGGFNVVAVSSSDTPVSIYHPCGALRGVAAVSERGLSAPNGAIYMDGLDVSAAIAANAGSYSIVGVAAQLGAPPVNVTAPEITGNLRYGNVLTVTPGTWTGHPAPTLTYQWKRNGTDITGETGTTYTSVIGDLSDAITCVETATNIFNTATEESASVLITEPLNISILTYAWSSDGTTEPHTASVGFVSGEVLPGDIDQYRFDTVTTFDSGDLQTTEGGLDSGELGAGAADVPSPTLTNDTWYGQVRIKRVYHTDGTYEVSDWSDYDDLVVNVGAGWTPDDLWVGSEAGGWWDASVLASMKQSNAGTTDVTTDNDVVGYWLDQGPNAHAITARADDTTRPAYNVDTGLHWVEFDGSNDLLMKTASLGLYNAGACTVLLAVRGNPAVSNILVSEGFKDALAATYRIVQANSSTATAQSQFIRNDANTQLANNISVGTGHFDNTDNVVAITDSGSSLVTYLDGVQTDSDSYTRSGTLTLNNFVLGACYGNNTAFQWFPCRVYAFIVIGRVLSAPELAAATTWLGAKMGRTL